MAFGLLTLIGYRLAGRERSTRWILAAVEAVQLYLHVWFAWTTPQAAPGPHAAPLMAHGHEAVTVIAHEGMSTPAMLAAHAVAGAMVALWLSAGERMLWRALRSLVRTLSSRLGGIVVLALPAPIPDRPAVAHPAADEDAPVTALLRHAVVRRGPPRGVRSLSCPV
ncbi:hypothetical protein SAMN05421874_101222 [Nonomuraea maritima]|uniref:Uncharacterized protein n=1 Tax=Nonomuraea maritima TaxID=683260 RepID=A0A1G8S9C0_9ACTN|nr:hypothetical protein [Nonomuraea maritima]SDJ25799.1 hypothetical protein SAMN05421874_101222 [Nonomuraea maritima]